MSRGAFCTQEVTAGLATWQGSGWAQVEKSAPLGVGVAVALPVPMRSLLVALALLLATAQADAGRARATRPNLVTRVRAKAKQISSNRAARRSAARDRYRADVAQRVRQAPTAKDALVALTKNRGLRSKLGRQFHWGNGAGEIVLATRTITTQVYKTRVERQVFGSQTQHDLVPVKAQVSLVMGRRGLELRASYPGLKQDASVARAERASLSMTPAGKVGVDKRLGLDVHVWGASRQLGNAGSVAHALSDPMWKGLKQGELASAVSAWKR